MPHITVDYAPRLEACLDVPEFCDVLRCAAIETEVFPLPGIRVRAIRADHVSIADGDPRHLYIDIAVRLRGGRDLQTRTAAAQHIFAAAEAFVAPLMEREPLALSLEMRDIDPALSPKTGSIRRFLTAEAPNG